MYFTFFSDGKSNAWYYDNENKLVTNIIIEIWDNDASIGYILKIYGIELNLHLFSYNLSNHSGYDFINLKKRKLQVGLLIRH